MNADALVILIPQELWSFSVGGAGDTLVVAGGNAQAGPALAHDAPPHARRPRTSHFVTPPPRAPPGSLLGPPDEPPGGHLRGEPHGGGDGLRVPPDAARGAPHGGPGGADGTGSYSAPLSRVEKPRSFTVSLPRRFRRLPQAGVDGLVCVFDVSKGPDEEEGMAGVLSVGSSVAKFGFFGAQLESCWVLTSTEDLSTWRWGDATQLGALQARGVSGLELRRCSSPASLSIAWGRPAWPDARSEPAAAEHARAVRGGCGGGWAGRGGPVRTGRLPHQLPLERSCGFALASSGAESASAYSGVKPSVDFTSKLPGQARGVQATVSLSNRRSAQGTAEGAAGVFPCVGAAVGLPGPPALGPPVAVAVVRVPRPRIRERTSTSGGARRQGAQSWRLDRLPQGGHTEVVRVLQIAAAADGTLRAYTGGEDSRICVWAPASAAPSPGPGEPVRVSALAHSARTRPFLLRCVMSGCRVFSSPPCMMMVMPPSFHAAGGGAVAKSGRRWRRG